MMKNFILFSMLCGPLAYAEEPPQQNVACLKVWSCEGKCNYIDQHFDVLTDILLVSEGSTQVKAFRSLKAQCVALPRGYLANEGLDLCH
jgi:hypothetical protein